MRYRYLRHTADVEFVAYGKDVKELIENAALAMLNVMINTKEVENSGGRTSSITITESGGSNDDIVWYTLQDMLSRVDAQQLHAFKFTVDSIRKNGAIKLKGRLYYKNTKRNYFLLGVKAVTPHGLKVKKSGNVYSTNIVLDV